jgi:serine/threonine protein kinase
MNADYLHTLITRRLINNFPRFLVNMAYAFQDTENLYLVLEYMPGGDLRYYINRRKTLTEDETSK